MSESQAEKKPLAVSVTYADPENPLWLKVQVPEGSTVEDAIRATDLLTRYPDLDLKTIKVGIFGKATQLEQPLNEGDRVELYRPITVDPKTVPRRKKTAEEK
jgi:hypothetical protein